MDGLIKRKVYERTEHGAVRDAGIIAASQKIEYYEIATYGTLVAFTKTLGEDEAARLLEQILNEEKEADVTLRRRPMTPSILTPPKVTQKMKVS